jgi:hypothetical protein
MNAQTQANTEIAEHEATFQWFVQFAYVAVFHVANLLVALAIAAVEGNWTLGFTFMVVASIFAFWALMRGVKLPLLVLLLISVSALVLRL